MLPSLSAKDIHNAGHLSFSCLIICRERVSLLCREWKRKKSFSCREWAPLPAVASFFSLFASCARHANCAYYINTLTVHIIQTHWLCISYRHTDCAYHTDTLTVRITQTHWLCVSHKHTDCAYHRQLIARYPRVTTFFTVPTFSHNFFTHRQLIAHYPHVTIFFKVPTFSQLFHTQTTHSIPHCRALCSTRTQGDQ